MCVSKCNYKIAIRYKIVPTCDIFYSFLFLVTRCNYGEMKPLRFQRGWGYEGAGRVARSHKKRNSTVLSTKFIARADTISAVDKRSRKYTLRKRPPARSLKLIYTLSAIFLQGHEGVEHLKKSDRRIYYPPFSCSSRRVGKDLQNAWTRGQTLYFRIALCRVYLSDTLESLTIKFCAQNSRERSFPHFLCFILCSIHTHFSFLRQWNQRRRASWKNKLLAVTRNFFDTSCSSFA